MRILITGGSGQLGTSLQRQLAETDYLAPSHAQLDITDAEQVYEFFQATRPDAVIHCAAYNNVDLAETEPEQCRLVNVKGTENIVAAARVFGSYVIYISSDYVFDGRKVGAYQTTDKKNPLSVYGASKSKAEDLVLAEPNNAVVRISWLFGPGERNFVRAVLRAAQARPSLSVVNDQIGSPTYTEDLAALLCEMLGKRPQGIFHATNEGVCSRAWFAEKVLEVSGIKTEIIGVTSEQYPSSAQRPLNSRLSKVSLDAAGLHRFPEWEDALTRYLAVD